MEADIYNFVIRQPSFGAIVFNGIPCQRKSDGVCGMFDIISKTFIPMQGTNITDTAAGTITQENMLFNVDKIEDSNNNIIWGSFDKFPYRRLEYIHFNGTDNFIYSGVGNKNGYYRSIICDIERNDIRQTTLATYDGMVDNARRRFYLFDIQPTSVTSGTRACLGNTWSTTVATSNIPLNTKLNIYATCQQNSSNYVMYAGIKRVDTGANIISQQTINNSTNAATGYQPYLMGCRTRSTDGVDRLENPVKGKLYQFDERSGNSSGTLTIRMVPCQRKSDGKYGMFDVIKNYFYILEGTQDNTSGGPIINEYWDLTAPD